MARAKDNTVDIEHYLEEKAEAVEAAYNDVIASLKKEKARMEKELRHEYKNARNLVRANPEWSLGIAFTAGLIAGALLTRSTME